MEAGDSSVDYTAWFSGAELRALQEVIDQGGYGRTTARYYFRGDRIAYCRETTLRTRTEREAEPGQDRIEKAFTFDESGHLAEFRKYVNGKPVTIEDKEVKEAIERGLKRREAALQLSPR